MTEDIKGIIAALPNKPLLRVDEVAEFFQVTKQTVYMWYENDKLKGCKIDNTLRIYRQSIVELIETNNGKKNGETIAEVEHKINKVIKKPVKSAGWIQNW